MSESAQAGGRFDPNGGNRQVIEIWEPTFRMKPREEERFVPRQVEMIIRDIMDKKLKKAKFDDQKCKVLALELCTEIKEKVKGQKDTTTGRAKQSRYATHLQTRL